jgi:hypothetical protein
MVRVRSVCYVYARTESALRNQYLTPAEALVIAQQLAKLPECSTAKFD